MQISVIEVAASVISKVGPLTSVVIFLHVVLNI